MRLYLASASPRRQELLRQLGIAFEAIPSNIEERPQPGESARDYVARVARDKARHVRDAIVSRGLSRHPVLGADTEVVIDGEIIGKPQDSAHGQALLRRLSGRVHEVLTGICLIHQHGIEEALSVTEVRFGRLSDADIARYWATGEPGDKAGGYAIQGRAAAFIERIEGSYSGVVGMPLYELNELLKRIGFWNGRE